jgi:hypothetical protein
MNTWRFTLYAQYKPGIFFKCMSDYRRGFGLVIVCIKPSMKVTTSKDYALTVLHISQITMGHARSSQSLTVFTSRCSITASNSRFSPFPGFQNCPRPQLPAYNSNSSQPLNPSCLLTCPAYISARTA